MFKPTVFFIAIMLAIIPQLIMADNEKPPLYDVVQAMEVGRTPLKTYYDSENGSATVICYGVDVNYDGIYDEGDEYPSIWTIDLNHKTPSVTKELDFPFNSLSFPLSPLRPDFDESNHLIYIPLMDRIIVYNTLSKLIDEDKSIDLISNSVNLSPDGKYLFATLPFINNTEGSVAIVDLETKNIVKQFYAGINVLETISYTRITPKDGGKLGLAVLSVGDYGSEESTLYYGDLNGNNIWDVDSVIIGNSGNNVIFYENKLFATVNMSNKIISFDLNTKDYKEFSTGTNSYNGPREIAVWDNNLFVTTYNGDVRYFNLNTGELDGNFGNNYKYESIEVFKNDFCLVTSPSDQTYSPNNQVLLVEQQVNTVFPERQDIQVGVRPIWVYFEPFSMIFHVFCQGYDANGNGIQESGDQLPSYWTLQSNTTEVWEDIVTDLPFNAIDFPFYPALDTRTGTFFLPQGDFVVAYNIKNIMDFYVAIPFKVKHLDIIDNYLVVTPHQSMPNKDSIYLYDIDTREIVRAMYAGTNPTMAIYCNNVKLDNEEQPAIAILNQNDVHSLINFIKFYDETSEINTSIEIESANSINFENNVLLATHKHSISRINTDNDEINVDSKLDMCGGDAEITNIYFIDEVVVCTFDNGKVRSFELIDNTVYPSPFVSRGNISSMSYYHEGPLNILVTANIKELDGTNSNFVSVWGKWLSSVEMINDGIVNTIKVYPNPAIDFTTVSLELNSEIFNNIDVSINSINGQELSSFNFPISDLKAMKLPVSNLASGVYLIKITIGNKTYNTKLNVVK